MQPIRKFLPFILMSLPILLVVADIVRHGQNVPYWDQWTSSATIANKVATHDLSLADIARQHIEHRIVFTNLMTAFFTYTTNWNIHLEMSVSIVLGLVILLLLYHLYKHDHPETAPVVLVIFAVLVFSIRQRENWLWGFQNQWYFMLAFFLLALLILRQNAVGWRPLVVAAGFTIGAVFSFGAGILAFPCLLVMLWLNGYRRWSYLFFWVITAILSLGLYFTNYTPVENERQFDPLRLAQFFLAYVGSPFVYRTPLMIAAVIFAIAGIGLFIANLLYLRRTNYSWERLGVWITLATFSLGGGLLAAPNRLSYGMDVALTSRYVVLASMFWVSMLALTILTLVQIVNHEGQPVGWRRVLVNTNMLVLSILLGFYLMENYQIGKAEPLVTEDSRACYQKYPQTQDFTCLGDINLVFNPVYDRADLQPQTLEVLEQLAENHLTLFAE